MQKIIEISIFSFLLFISAEALSQKVGLVLSGGGALGLAHIGVIKALEENDIPIDYITGTSAGAMVGGFYASGFSPDEMSKIVESDAFLKMAYGNIDEKLSYYFKEENPDPALLQIKLDKDFSISKAIPTNFTNSALLDFEFMRVFSGVSAKAQYNFNELFVPFRCVAADVVSKSPVVFSHGHLNQAIRASMTYPGYLRPIRVEGKLLFDGGLYNNFPTDVMFNDFFPDIIIGVNLSDSVIPPDEDDVISQLKSMVINRNNPQSLCENDILISPKVNIGTFDFDKAKEAIQAGYDATMASMDDIKTLIRKRVEKVELEAKRNEFKQGIKKGNIHSIQLEGVTNKQAKYIRNALIRNNEIEIDFNLFKKRFFKLLSDNKIKTLYPLADYDYVSKKYNVKINVVQEKPIQLKFGGAFSSRPINTGYFGVIYNHLGRIGTQIESDIYFGKFYGSTGLGFRFDFNTKVPFYIRPFGVLNNWDYFKSFATFFDEVKPSYIIRNERFVGVDMGGAVNNSGRVVFTVSKGRNKDRYYQNSSFTKTDTADVTLFYAQTYGARYESSTLNRKLYATKGYRINIASKFIEGQEYSFHGNTSSTENIVDKEHYSFWFKFEAEKYFMIHKNLRFGLDLEVVNVWRNSLFGNYTAALLYSPIYRPFPESKTLYYPTYASDSYIGVGTKLITPINANIDLRGELYIFRPNVLIKDGLVHIPYYDYQITFSNYRYMASTKLVVNSMIGPLTLAVNYYDAQPVSPWNFSVNYGYVIQNRRFVRL